MADPVDELLEELRPQDASSLAGKQLAEELEKRGLKVSGFADDDIKSLQRAYNAEFERDRTEKMKQRAELLAKRKAEEERLRMQRWVLCRAQCLHCLHLSNLLCDSPRALAASSVAVQVLGKSKERGARRRHW